MSTYVIFAAVQPFDWLVAHTTAAECAVRTVSGTTEADSVAPAIAKALQELGYADEGVLLALPSQMCLSAVVDSKGLRRRSRDATLLFRLEEQLPVASEEIVADFIDAVPHCLGIAVTISAVEALIGQLEAEGIAIASICPSAFLAFEELRRRHSTLSDLDGIVIQLSGHLDLILTADSTASGWVSVSARKNAALSHLLQAALAQSRPLRLAAIGFSADEFFTQNPKIEWIQNFAGDSWELAARTAHRCLTGETQALVELRRGKLADQNRLRRVRAPLKAALTAFALLGVIFSLAAIWRAGRFERLADTARAREISAFREALPGRTPPSIITSRLYSEERRLQGVSGNAASMPETQSILPQLYDTLTALSLNLRYRLLELRIEPNRLYLQGQTLDHGSADQIAESLRKNTVLLVEPPHTQQSAGEDVNFIIAANAAQTVVGGSR